MTVPRIVQRWFCPLVVVGFIFTGIPSLLAQNGNAVLNATGAYLVSTRDFHNTLLDRIQPNFIQPCYSASCNIVCGKETLWGDFSLNWVTQADVGSRPSYEYRPSTFLSAVMSGG